MDKFVSLDAKDKRAYFEVAAANLNIMPQLVEKDFWVCWILKVLFSLPEVGSHLTFKGGTSLSKCYNVIKRFSEDIDISIERPFLSKAKTIEPDKEKSNKENQKRLKELQTVCKTKIDCDKITDLRKEEDGLKKLLAGYELREIERERSEGYINRVKDFLYGYDDSKEKIDFADKKQLAGLLFKNIKIAPAIGGALPPKRISFSLFAPFNFLFSETEGKTQCQKNQKLTKICPKKSTSAPSAAK
jgi:hypothetical protein